MASSVNILPMALLAIVAIVLVGLPVVLGILASSRFRQKRHVSGAILVAFALLALFGAVILIHPSLPGGDAILARVTASDGTELCLIQKSNYSIDPYTVSFYYKRPGRPWGRFYYEHEDTRWYKGSISFNDEGTTAYIKRGRNAVAIFELKTASFTIKRWNRTSEGAQEWMFENWTPEQHVRGKQD